MSSSPSTVARRKAELEAKLKANPPPIPTALPPAYVKNKPATKHKIKKLPLRKKEVNDSKKAKKDDFPKVQKLIVRLEQDTTANNNKEPVPVKPPPKIKKIPVRKSISNKKKDVAVKEKAKPAKRDRNSDQVVVEEEKKEETTTEEEGESMAGTRQVQRMVRPKPVEGMPNLAMAEAAAMKYNKDKKKIQKACAKVDGTHQEGCACIIL